MKKPMIIVIIIACVLLICGRFYISMQNETQTETELTEVQKIIMKDLESDYPKTPREVVKLYNRIVEAYYEIEMEEKELRQLTTKMQGILDDELLMVNSDEEYYNSVLNEIVYYKENEMYISKSDVCASNEVKFVTDKDKGDNLAYVPASYFIKRGSDFVKTYQEFVLREDENGKWKILAFYEIEGEAEDE